MSPRRLIIPALAALAAVGTAGATMSWPVGTPTAAAFVSRGLGGYGLALTAEGATAITLLPLPRLSFTRTRIAAGPGGPALIEGGGLVIALNPLALLSGQADVDSLVLDGATIRIPGPEGDPGWAEPLRRLSARLGQGGTHPRRITLTRTTLSPPEPVAGAPTLPAQDVSAQDLDLTLAWPVWSATLDAAATLTWRGARTSVTLAGLRPADLLDGAGSPFALGVRWPAGSLNAEGRAATAGGLALTGQGRIETRSLPETLAWIGGGVALAPFLDAVALEGRFETRGRAVSLPAIRATVGGDVLEGAGSVTLGERRAAVQATLAADHLNLAPLLGGLVRMFGPEDDGAGDPARLVALAPLTGGDLDLRLSAAEGRVGPVVLADLAASVLVRPDAVEVALNRAGVRGGTLKGRLALSSAGADGAGTAVKAQGAFDRLDLGALLLELGEARWVLGGAQGQFALESTGRDVAELAAHVAGRAALAIDGGMIAGLDLADVIHRNGAVAPGALARRNGRTPFERAAVTLRFSDGIGEVGEGSLRAANLAGSLRGRVSLPERTVRGRAEIGPRAGAAVEPSRPAAVFDIAGPWNAVAVRTAQGEPDSRGDGPTSRPASVRLPGAARAYAP